MACSYCYVARRKGYANPITTFVNTEEILGALERHVAKQGMKLGPTQADRDLWVYELGTNSDLSVDAAISVNVRDSVQLFQGLPNAKATFATKFVNRDLLAYDPRGKTRIRFSLMPPETSKLVDVRTLRVEDRIVAINDFVEAGYEVNVNFGPVIFKEGWLSDYADLFGMLDSALSQAQLAAEVIFLTHTEESHEVNLSWHPEGEKHLWRPDLQEHKRSQASGDRVLRYERDLKRRLVADFRDLLSKRLHTARSATFSREGNEGASVGTARETPLSTGASKPKRSVHQEWGSLWYPCLGTQMRSSSIQVHPLGS